MTGLVGQGVERVDGRVKVTGAARYAADNEVADALHGFLTMSTIARGEILEIDTGAALAHPGVVAVYTHRDMPRLKAPAFPYTKGFVPMQDTRIHHHGQPVAYAVAETLEQAQEAAALVRVRYRGEEAVVRLADAMDQAEIPPDFRAKPNERVKGDAESALRQAAVRIDQSYGSPMHHHNPIEPPTTTAVWQDGKLTIYESAQGVVFSRMIVAEAFGLIPDRTVDPGDRVRVIAPYLGGGFGAKGPVYPHTLLTAAAAQLVGRPVKLVLSRAQMYTSSGHRSEFNHHLQLGSTRDGRLTAIVSTSVQQLSRTEDGVYNASDSALDLYTSPNVHVRQLGVKLDLHTGSYMRSPETTAHFGLETALDELSYEIGLDPVELRLRNTATTDANIRLAQCYRTAAEAFGWERRDPRPGRTRDGDERIGWGMATEFHSFGSIDSFASITIGLDGRATLRTASQDIGTGTYTVLTQVAADRLGLPLDHVTTLLGDTAFPRASISAGSSTMPSVVGPVDQAAMSARAELIRIAVGDPYSVLHGVPTGDVGLADGWLYALRDPRRRERVRRVMGRRGTNLVVHGERKNSPGHTYGAVFVEVRIRPQVGALRVSRVVAAYDLGKVLNRRTARGQVIGGVTWGLGFALMEHTMVDPNTARIVNPNLSAYLVPVCADVPSVEALFVDQVDSVREPSLGARGFGETPGTGVPAAIGNAIFHATGRRLRDVPFTQDKLL
ncbi:xanthine dehydrogenase family protein molybdopterin-binding subunit [Nocardioides panzhihuensis]|uniref:Xanthine dehydrogenase YagR molybdenum-binding subunit n=1 Tax=Nocardioides panzhihuensis TaxID=860243 RepID=A0A7Z0IS42_9ACTN|nr:xanthine dehydrogenase family protein molybdopterin-binding subunit [Nocardioides panzhihuensis]NYI77556.1 xanthine dehydrogenase YagR molybdenum-binding subunit [Nocardioides panzhihuensis]